MNIIGEAPAPHPMYYQAREALRLTNNARNSSQSEYSKERSKVKNYFLSKIEERIKEGYTSWIAENTKEGSGSFVDSSKTELYIDILADFSNSGYQCSYKMREGYYNVIDIVVISWRDADKHPGSLYAIH